MNLTLRTKAQVSGYTATTGIVIEDGRLHQFSIVLLVFVETTGWSLAKARLILYLASVYIPSLKRDVVFIYLRRLARSGYAKP